MEPESKNRGKRFTWELEDLDLGWGGIESIFNTGVAARDKFSSRLFGLFSEDVVRDWCAAPQSRFANVGRPTLYADGEARGYTLDFALQPPDATGVFVAEMKCELEFEGYRYLTLETASQIEHHRSPAFLRFLDLSFDPQRFEVRIGGRPRDVLGTILVWGAASQAGKAAAKERYGFSDVLTVDECLADLKSWGGATPWRERVDRLRGWSNSLFDGLVGITSPEASAPAVRHEL